ncbi:hypothetical protein D5F11_010835 [Siminovitchia terrae]|uniref:Uncharacterized protein n=1 Tax=Siminovitchia terrae TaxID=1914933 RepID=A0A429X899_SIMTE|nr:hypothetical protein [Siminovitchia terrae]RST59596.1 hypothetical protein D5F11_010835 [Siminovitchia terrae]
MGYSEIAVILFVYSGLMTFFLIPFQRRAHSKSYQQNQISFISIFKSSLVKMIFHKKAILALTLLGFMLISIWLGYAGVEDHYNAHSGYSSISTNFKAIYTICGVFVYTVVLLLLLGYVRTLKIVKSTNK